MVLVVFGDGAVAQTVLSKQTAGTFLSINLAWGIAVTMGIFATGGISGAHINPAVSLSFACSGEFPWWKLPGFVFSQVLGGFAAAALVCLMYIDALWSFHLTHDIMSTASIFATYPQSFETIASAFCNELFASALLVGGIFAINDHYRNREDIGKPFAIGLLVTAIGMSFGYNTGYAINPARDLGPRLFTALAGWGSDVFFTLSRGDLYFWVPIVAPSLGALIGAAIYTSLIASQRHEYAQ